MNEKRKGGAKYTANNAAQKLREAGKSMLLLSTNTKCEYAQLTPFD